MPDPNGHVHRDLERRVETIDRELSEFRKTSVALNMFDERDQRVKDALSDIRGDIREIKESQRASRNLIASALLAAAMSVVIQVVLFFVLKGGGA